MNRIFIALVFLAFPLFLARHSAASPDIKSSSACRAVAKEPDFGGPIEMPPQIRDLISRYREGWRKLCARAGKGGDVYVLYGKAKEIEKEFSTVFEEADKLVTRVRDDQGPEASFRKAQEMHQMLKDRYPSFVPLFKGSYIEYNYFRADPGDFRQYAPFGDSEDALFFREYFGLREESLFYPWFRQTWDYGGCLRFGEYQWVAALKKIDSLKRDLSKPLYREMAAEFDEKLKAVLEGLYGEGYTRDICACGEKSAVKADLKTILDYAASIPGFDKTADAVEKALRGIEEGSIRVNSEAQGHCSGG